MLSIVTVASSTRMPTARLRPPSVMMLSVWPVAASAMIAARIDSGIDTATMTVDRHDPRNSRIMMLVSTAAIAPSLITPDTAAFTNSDWSPIATTFSVSGSVAWILGSASLIPCTIASVEVDPFFRIVISTDRDPSTWTTLVCGAVPSRTCATSRM